MSMGVTRVFATVLRALPVTPPAACAARVGKVLLDRLRDREDGLVEGDDVARRLHRVDDVVDARVVAGAIRDARATVCVGDRLERGLMRAHVFNRHALKELSRWCR